MPIYAYRCESCGFQKDVLQKLSDSPLHQCPNCGQDAFRKQVTAAGFQLKGSGWYVTDFRQNGSAPAAKPASGAKDGATESGKEAKEGGKSDAPAKDGAAKSADSGSSGGAAPAAPTTTS
jgi:putative FmdB family regulatory protein